MTGSRRHQRAKELLRRAAASAGHDPALRRELLELRAEARELMAGLRCWACLQPMGDASRVPSESLGWVHRHGSCSGMPRRPLSSQVAGRP